MIYTRPFLDLQLHFAHRVAELSGLSLADALLGYTNLYIRFGLGRAFDAEHPIWKQYLVGMEDTTDPGEWTHRFYLMRTAAMRESRRIATVGCFSYGLLDDDRIRIHFRNLDTGEHSSLSRIFIEQRRAELTSLFAHVRQTLPAHTRVVGRSWLYNLDAYRRLFPPFYIATARRISPRFQFMPLWGQFIDRRGELKEQMVHPFLDRLEQQREIEHLYECFPLQVLEVEAEVREFGDFYG